MKKPQLKLDERYKKSIEGIPKNPVNASYFPNNHSAQNLRQNNIVVKERDSPLKNDQSYKNSRRPDFLKNISKGAFTLGNQQRKMHPDERRSYKEGFAITREDPNGNGQSKQRENINKIKVGPKGKQLRETVKSDNSEYQKLNDKLNYIQNKINELSSNIDKKRQEKLVFLENQKKERQKRLQKWGNNNIQQSKLKESLQKFVTQANDGKEYVTSNFNPYSPKHNTYYVSEILKFYKEERSLAREHITMSAQYLRIFQGIRVPTEQEAMAKAVKLTKKSIHQDKKTVIFDLDETLIHCNDTLQTPYDVKLRIKFPTGEQIQAGINIRPYAIDILKALSRNFEVIVFTASHSCYANVVIDYLDPQKQYVHHRLFRQHCHVTAEGVYVKDLRVINRDPSQMILVDNAAYSYAFQLDNAIPILPYYKGKNDYELKALQTYIEGMLLVKDMRELNRRTFKLHRYRDYDNIDQLVKELYAQHS